MNDFSEEFRRIVFEEAPPEPQEVISRPCQAKGKCPKKAKRVKITISQEESL